MPGYREAQPPGFEMTKELRTWESQKKCPRCPYELFTGEKAGIRIDACGWCGGVFLDNEQAMRALAEKSHAPEELAAKVESVTRPVRIVETEPPRCPVCSDTMKRQSVNGVAVDTCVHGTWFDRNELGAAMRAMRGETKLVAADSLESRYLREQELRKGVPFGAELDHVKTVIGEVLDAMIAVFT